MVSMDHDAGAFRPGVAEAEPLSEKQFLIFKKLFGAKLRVKLYRSLANKVRRNQRPRQMFASIYRNRTDDGRRGHRNVIPVVVADLYHHCIDKSVNPNVALARWVPAQESLVLSALDDSPLNADVLDVLADMTQRRARNDEAMSSATGPIKLSVVLIIGILWAASVYYFPALDRQSKALTPGELVTTFRALSQFMRDYSLMLVPLALAIPPGFRWILRNWTGPLRQRFEQLPFFAGYRKWTGISFLMSITPLMAADTTKDDALQRLIPHAEPYVAERLTALLHIEGTLPEALARSGHDWPSREIIHDLADDMDEDNKVEALQIVTQNALSELTAFYDELAKWVTIFQPVALGLFIAFLSVVMADFRIPGFN